METQKPATTATEEYEEIDLKEIAFVLLHKIRLLLVSLFAGAVLAGAITFFLITPQYTASSMIYIYTKTTSITSLADLQIGSQLAVDFQTLGTSRPVIERVITDLNLDTSYDKLLETITVTNPSNSRILKISVENPDPQLAADISNDMAAALSDRVAEVMSTDKPATVETAVVPDKPSSPSLLRNTAIGGLLGLVAAMGFAILQYYLDDTIKSEDDVAKYLGVNVLAAIPLEHHVTDEKGKKKGSAQKHKPSGASRPRSAAAQSGKSSTRAVSTAAAARAGSGTKHVDSQGSVLH